MFYRKECIYLDAAATSRFKPKKVIRRISEELSHSANAGRGGHKASIHALECVEECRRRIAEVTGFENAILTKSCTEALNLALCGGEYTGEVLTDVFEHNSVLRPLERLKLKGVKVRYLSPADGVITTDLLKSNLTGKTSLVCIQEMSNVTGTIQPIDDLGNLLSSFGIPFLVDGAQSLGHTDCSYKGVTMLAGAGHKALHGMQGTGFLAVRNDVRLTPLIAGGTGTSSASLLQPKDIPEGFEAGTQNAAGFAGLAEGIVWTMKNKEKIRAATVRLSERLLKGLSAIEGVEVYSKSPNGVISFNVGEHSSSSVADTLDSEYSICVRAGLHCAPLMHKFLGTFNRGAVRASVDWGNTDSDIDALLKAVREIARR